MKRFQERRNSVGVEIDPAVLRAPTARGTTSVCQQHQGASMGASGHSNQNPQTNRSNSHPQPSSGASDMSWVLSGSRNARIGAPRGPRVSTSSFEPRPDAYVGDGLKVRQFHTMSQLTVGSQAMNSDSSFSDKIMYAGPPVYQNFSLSQHSTDSFASARASRGSFASVGRSVGFCHNRPSVQNVEHSTVPAGPFTTPIAAHRLQATRTPGCRMPIFLSSNQNPSEMLLRLAKTRRQRNNKGRPDSQSVEKLPSDRGARKLARARSTASVCTESTSDNVSIASRPVLEILSTSGTQDSGTSETTNLRHDKEDNIMQALQAELKALFSKEMKEFHSFGDRRMNSIEQKLTENVRQCVGEHLEAQIDDQSSRLCAALKQSSDDNLVHVKSQIATMHSSIKDKVSQDMQVQLMALAETDMKKTVKELVSNTSSAHEKMLQDQVRKGENQLQATAQVCVDKLNIEGTQIKEGLKSHMEASKEELVASGRAAVIAEGSIQVDLVRKTGTTFLSQIQDSAKIAFQMLNDLSAGSMRSMEAAFGIVSRDKGLSCENTSSPNSGSTTSKRAANDDVSISPKRRKTRSITNRTTKLMREAEASREEPPAPQSEIFQSSSNSREEMSTPARSAYSGRRSRSCTQATPEKTLAKSLQEIQTTETPQKQDQSLQTSLTAAAPSSPENGASEKVTPASKQVRRSTLVTPLPCGDKGPEQTGFEDTEEPVQPRTAPAEMKRGGSVEESPCILSGSISDCDDAPIEQILIHSCPSPMSDITNVEYGTAPRKTKQGKKDLNLNRRKLFGSRQTSKLSAKQKKKTKLESHRRTKRTFSKRTSSMGIGSLSFSFDSACKDSGLQF